MIKFSIVFYAAVIAFVVLANFGIGGQSPTTNLQQLSNSELALSTLN